MPLTFPNRMSRRNVVKSALVCAALALTPLPASTTATASSAAEQYVTSVANSILAVASGPQGQMSSKFRALMSRHAAINAIGVFSLGKYKDQLPASQRTEYYGLIEKFVAGLFVKYAPQFAGNRIEITNSKARSARDVIVSSKVHFASGKAPLEVQWRLLQSGGGFKIFDVRVLGIWLAIQQRTEFTSVIKNNGGDVSALMKFLRGS